MKIRNGFVSNSSSSSFVVAFPNKPKNIKELEKMMFGDKKWHYSGIYGDTDTSQTEIIAEAVFKIISEEETVTRKRILESLRNGWFDPYKDNELFPGLYSSFEKTKFLNFPKDEIEIRRIWDESDKINDERASNIIDAFIEDHKDHFFAVMEFSDNDGGFWSMMEHSGIFKNIDHIQTSYH